MAACLNLKTILDFNSAHAGVEYDFHCDPATHFCDLFATLFAIHEKFTSSSPTLPVDIIRRSLQSCPHDVRWIKHRIHRYLDARRRVGEFLKQVIKQRRARLNTALSRWETHEAAIATAEDERIAREIRENRARKEEDRIPISFKSEKVPRRQKLAILVIIHRAKVHNLTLSCRSAVRHRQQLQRDVASVSRRLAHTWLQGSCRGRGAMQLAARLYGMKKRLQAYTIVMPERLDSKWNAMPIDELEQMVQEIRLKNEISAAKEAFVAMFCIDMSDATGPVPRMEPTVIATKRKEYCDAVESALQINGVGGHVFRMQVMRTKDDTNVYLPPRHMVFGGYLEDIEPQTETNPEALPATPKSQLCTKSPLNSGSSSPASSPPSSARDGEGKKQRFPSRLRSVAQGRETVCPTDPGASPSLSRQNSARRSVADEVPKAPHSGSTTIEAMLRCSTPTKVESNDILRRLSTEGSPKKTRRAKASGRLQGRKQSNLVLEKETAVTKCAPQVPDLTGKPNSPRSSDIDIASVDIMSLGGAEWCSNPSSSSLLSLNQWCDGSFATAPLSRTSSFTCTPSLEENHTFNDGLLDLLELIDDNNSSFTGVGNRPTELRRTIASSPTWEIASPSSTPAKRQPSPFLCHVPRPVLSEESPRYSASGAQDWEHQRGEVDLRKGSLDCSPVHPGRIRPISRKLPHAGAKPSRTS